MPGNFSFTKLVVDDLEGMSAYYQQAYGLKEHGRIQAEIDGDPIDEIFLGAESGHGPGSIMLLKFTTRPAPSPGAIILGFQTDDLETLLGEVESAGGRRQTEISESEVAPVRVAFTVDPEGNASENIQIMEPTSAD